MQHRAAVLISNDMFKRDVRSALLDLASQKRSDMPYAHYSHLPDVPHEARAVAISYHGALEGPDRRAAVPGDYINEFSKVLEGLEYFFEGTEICIHLTVICQHDYGLIVDSQDCMAVAVSWADVASRILDAVPSASLTVWALEKPGSLAVPFVLSVLGMSDVAAPRSLHRSITRLGYRERFATPIYPIENPNDPRSEYLDDLYDRDLAILQTMPRVTLMRG